MKKVSITFLGLALMFASCKKDDGNGGGTTNLPQNCLVSPYRVGTKITMNSAFGGTTTSTIDKDTAISGRTYFRVPNGGFTSYVAVASNGDFYQKLPQIGDLPATDMIYSKPSQSVGTSWSYSFPSVAYPTTRSYQYTFTILSNTDSFTLGSTKYTNGIVSKVSAQGFLNGTASGAASVNVYHFFCGLGNVKTTNETGTTIVNEMVGFTY